MDWPKQKNGQVHYIEINAYKNEWNELIVSS